MITQTKFKGEVYTLPTEHPDLKKRKGHYHTNRVRELKEARYDALRREFMKIIAMAAGIGILLAIGVGIGAVEFDRWVNTLMFRR